MRISDVMTEGVVTAATAGDHATPPIVTGEVEQITAEVAKAALPEFYFHQRGG